MNVKNNSLLCLFFLFLPGHSRGGWTENRGGQRREPWRKGNRGERRRKVGMKEENLEEEAENKSKNGEGEPTESTQRVRALAVKFNDLSSIPRTHIAENRLPKLSSVLQMYAIPHACICAH